MVDKLKMKKTIILLGILVICMNVNAMVDIDEKVYFTKQGSYMFGGNIGGFKAVYSGGVVTFVNPPAFPEFSCVAEGKYYIYIVAKEDVAAGNRKVYAMNEDTTKGKAFTLTQAPLGNGYYAYMGYFWTNYTGYYIDVDIINAPEILYDSTYWQLKELHIKNFTISPDQIYKRSVFGRKDQLERINCYIPEDDIQVTIGEYHNLSAEFGHYIKHEFYICNGEGVYFVGCLIDVYLWNWQNYAFSRLAGFYINVTNSEGYIRADPTPNIQGNPIHFPCNEYYKTFSVNPVNKNISSVTWILSDYDGNIIDEVTGTIIPFEYDVDKGLLQTTGKTNFIIRAEVTTLCGLSEVYQWYLDFECNYANLIGHFFRYNSTNPQVNVTNGKACWGGVCDTITNGQFNVTNDIGCHTLILYDYDRESVPVSPWNYKPAMVKEECIYFSQEYKKYPLLWGTMPKHNFTACFNEEITNKPRPNLNVLLCEDIACIDILNIPSPLTSTDVKGCTIFKKIPYDTCFYMKPSIAGDETILINGIEKKADYICLSDNIARNYTIVNMTQNLMMTFITYQQDTIFGLKNVYIDCNTIAGYTDLLGYLLLPFEIGENYVCSASKELWKTRYNITIINFSANTPPKKINMYPKYSDTYFISLYSFIRNCWFDSTLNHNICVIQPIEKATLHITGINVDYNTVINTDNFGLATIELPKGDYKMYGEKGGYENTIVAGFTSKEGGNGSVVFEVNEPPPVDNTPTSITYCYEHSGLIGIFYMLFDLIFFDIDSGYSICGVNSIDTFVVVIAFLAPALITILIIVLFAGTIWQAFTRRRI